jgi:hypothetical protein
MRQIRPRTTQPDPLPVPLPVGTVEPAGIAPTALDSTQITVDLRDHMVRHPSYSDEKRIRRQLDNVRAALEVVMRQLSELIDERESLKTQLGLLPGSHADPQSAPNDHSIVAWGFYDDDL